MNARLAMEAESVRRTLARSTRASLRRAAPDGRAYEVLFDVRTVVRGKDRVIREEARRVPVLYELAPDHPHRPPLVIAGQADLFNVHIHDPFDGCDLPPLAFVCLGSFSPGMTIADWIVSTYRVLAWARIAAAQPFSHEAAVWARQQMGEGRFPIDRRGFFESGTPSPTQQAPQSEGASRRQLRLRSRSEA